MSLNFVPTLAAALVSITALILFNRRDWRLSIWLLSMQYIGVFVLVLDSWPVTMAATKLIAGWMSGAILGIAIQTSTDLRQKLQEEAPNTSLSIRQQLSRDSFYLLVALLVLLAVFSAAAPLSGWVKEISPTASWGALVLMSMGLLKLGFTNQPLHVILSLLTTLSGFEVFYAHVETSALVAGLLAMSNLGLAFVGAYMLLAPQMSEAE